MTRYIAIRLALFLPTLLGASLLVFLALRLLPGDVALTALGGSSEVHVNPEQVERVRQELGLDAPLPVQYGRWLWSMATGDFGGRSLESRMPIASLLGRQLPVTLLLTLYTVAVSVAVAVPLGVLAAAFEGRWSDYLVRLFAIGGQSVAPFFVAVLLLMGLLLAFRWAPPIIYAHPWQDPWRHLQMLLWPVLALAWGYGAYLARMTRASLVEALRQDYIRTARTKGLPERLVLLRHGLRNAIIPVISVAGLQVSVLLGGVVVLEMIFGLPGLGRGIALAAAARDYPVVQTYAVVLAFLVLAVNLITDILYAWADPRITYEA
ncbi:MAG: ABC transporter permease [Chloroflexi bacterium]|nr:ABC transporter permease [Chloroflexota bacterium]